MIPRRVLIAEGRSFSLAAAQQLSGAGFLVTLADLNRAELKEALATAHILWVRLRTRIDADLLRAAPDLRCIVTATTGLNHIDEGAAAARGIRILCLRGETEFLKNVHATAEHTVALMLALIRKLPGAAWRAARGGWDRDRFRGIELFGKTVGIVGYGRVGRMVAGLVEAFGSSVVACDPCLRNGPGGNGIGSVPLHQLLRQSDLVSIHANLIPRTAGFFGQRQFHAMKPEAFLINTARGELLDEAALLEALAAGRIAGAALDVLSGERSAGMSEHPVVRYAKRHSNLLITPHIGGCTAESMEMTERFLAERLCREFAPAGKAPVEYAGLVAPAV
ncbi:MAG: NAD(P)-dependent oxidoreductase [Candidatus Solibacter sp.]|jgi:phosphoglycerate dehydrogenase-like enzyme